MADVQDNVTPEEKLLNVIHSGGDKPASAADRPVVAEQKAAAAPVSAVVAEKEAVVADKTAVTEAPSEPVVEKPVAKEKPADKVPAESKPAGKAGKMKLAKAPAKAEQIDADTSPENAADAVEPAKEPVAPEGGVAAFAKKQKGEGSGVTTINRMLAAGILILLGLSGIEVFRVVRGNGAVRRLVELEMPEAKGSPVSAMEVQQVYGSDIFWRSSDAGGSGGSQTTTQTITVNATPWADYMKQNVKLMGISMRSNKPDSEAILMDNTDKRMYFVRLGGSFSVQGVDVRLDDLENERARFSDGKNSIELK